MHTHQLGQDLDQGPMIVRALSSITRQQAAVITQAAAACGPDWIVQTCNDYDGYLSIMIEPADRSSKQSDYYISGTASRIELAEIQNESLNALERHHDAAKIATRLAEILDLSGHVAH